VNDETEKKTSFKKEGKKKKANLDESSKTELIFQTYNMWNPKFELN